MPDQSRDLITFVCTGNVCRSPMAERLMAHALAGEEPPLCNLRVTSAGLAAANGESASENSILALEKVGLSLSDFRSKLLDQDLVDRSLVLFCMTENHRSLINLNFNVDNTPVYLVREFMDEEDAEIPDPIGMDYQTYESTRDSIVEAIPSILEKLKKIPE